MAQVVGLVLSTLSFHSLVSDLPNWSTEPPFKFQDERHKELPCRNTSMRVEDVFCASGTEWHVCLGKCQDLICNRLCSKAGTSSCQCGPLLNTLDLLCPRTHFAVSQTTPQASVRSLRSQLGCSAACKCLLPQLTLLKRHFCVYFASYTLIAVSRHRNDITPSVFLRKGTTAFQSPAVT